MILFRNRLIFGVVKKFISGIFLSVYKVLSLFNLQYTLLIACIGAVLYLTGTLNSSQTVLVVFIVLLAVSLLYAGYTTLSRFLGLDKKKEKKPKNSAPAVDQEQSSVAQNVTPIPVEYGQTQPYPYPFENKSTTEQPKYFRVNGHPDYIMAEYSDRYELYKVSNGQMIKIRTDYKY